MRIRVLRVRPTGQTLSTTSASGLSTGWACKLVSTAWAWAYDRVWSGARPASESRKARVRGSSRLNKLIEHGILERVPLSDGAVRHEYAPTPKGEDLYKGLIALMQWGQAHFFDEEPGARRLIDRITGDPIADIEIRSTAGRPLTPDDLQVLSDPAEITRG